MVSIGGFWSVVHASWVPFGHEDLSNRIPLLSSLILVAHTDHLLKWTLPRSRVFGNVAPDRADSHQRRPVGVRSCRKRRTVKNSVKFQVVPDYYLVSMKGTTLPKT